MSLALPGADTGTDGQLLRDHALHAIVLDMITRTQIVWPRYGTSPGYEQSGPGGHGFQEICTSSLATALEWGMFEYAEGVLDNYLEYFVRSRGRVLCKDIDIDIDIISLGSYCEQCVVTGRFLNDLTVCGTCRPRTGDVTARPAASPHCGALLLHGGCHAYSPPPEEANRNQGSPAQPAADGFGPVPCGRSAPWNADWG